jgi:hypothetical protein
MTTPRGAYQINASHPGSDLAAETAAAMAAASIVFQELDPTYSANLLSHARQVPQELTGSIASSLAFDGSVSSVYLNLNPSSRGA